MEVKLRQQRNRLFLRIILILLAMWTVIYTAYCAIVLHNEKNRVQNNELTTLSYAEQLISLSEQHTSTESYVYISNSNLLYFKDMVEKDFDKQIILIDFKTNRIVADTAYKISVVYSFKNDLGAYPDDDCILDYNTIRQSLSDSQYEKIVRLLNTECGDGRRYELVCTEFCVMQDEVIPLEMSVMSVEGAEDRFSPGHITESFRTNRRAAGQAVYRNGDSRLNIIPKDFLLNGAYNRDYISMLSDEQREKSSLLTPIGFGEYLCYVTEYHYLDAFIYNSEKGNYENIPNSYQIQYARKINLIASCRSQLAFGAGVTFVFFFVIGFILCLMIWKMVKMQVMQEKKRADLTNALAHDIKTPLFVISGYAYTLKEDIDTDQRENCLDKIIQQTDRINDMVHKMLNLSKLDSYNMTLNRTDFDLYGLVVDLLKDYDILPDGKSISVTHSGENEVNADRELIRTALQNLTDNAVKYSLTGSDIHIDITDRTFSISNRSEPLTRAELKQIWQPYFRKDKSRHHTGIGFGLSIVKSIFDLHGIKCDMSMKDSTLTCCVKF